MKEKGVGEREREKRKSQNGRTRKGRWWNGGGRAERTRKSFRQPLVGGCAEITVTGSITDDVILLRKICRETDLSRRFRDRWYVYTYIYMNIYPKYRETRENSRQRVREERKEKE